MPYVLHVLRHVVLLLVAQLVHVVAFVEPVRPAFTAQPGGVPAAGPAGPGVAPDVGLVLGVLLAVLGLGVAEA